MRDEFIQNKLYIRITRHDESLLADLQTKLGLTWNSGECINGAATRRYISEYKVIYIDNEGSNGVMYADHCVDEGRPWVTVEQFIDECNTFELSEDDILNVLE